MRAPSWICLGLHRKLLLLVAVTLPNTGANAGPTVGVDPVVLKFRQGEAELQVTVPLGVATVPVDWMKYPVWFTDITFCLLAMLKKSVDSSSLYLSWKVK